MQKFSQEYLISHTHGSDPTGGKSLAHQRTTLANSKHITTKRVAHKDESESEVGLSSRDDPTKASQNISKHSLHSALFLPLALVEHTHDNKETLSHSVLLRFEFYSELIRSEACFRSVLQTALPFARARFR